MINSLSILLLICLIVVCSLFIITYIKLRNQKTIYEINKKEAIAEKEKLDSEIRVVRGEYERYNKKLDSVKIEYQNKKELIDNTKKIIEQTNKTLEEQFKEREKILQEKYTQLDIKLDNQYQLTKKNQDIEIAQIQNQLNSLKATRDATLEALRKEEELKANQDYYRLDISERDERDIEILNNIKPQISKPRLLSMLIWQTYYQPIAKKKFPLILGENKVCGIYKITNIKDNKCYIGQAVDIRDRWNQHCKHGLDIDTPQRNKLYQAILKYKLENFTFELIEECPKEELNQKEKYYINLYNSCTFGYNSNIGVG